MDLKLVFFFYGLAFFTVGITTWIRIKPLADLRLARIFGWLAAFGFIHAACEWIDMFAVMGHAVIFLSNFNGLLKALSFAVLLQFGIEFFGLKKNLPGIIRLIPTILFLLWFSLFFRILFSDEGVKVAEIWSRYILGLPGTLISAGAFISGRKKISNNPRISRNIFLAGLCFGFYAIFTVIVPKADFFPASILNYPGFLSLVGLPVQVFRTLCAVAITFFVTLSLEVFDIEEKRTLEVQVEEKTRALSEDITERKRTEETLRRSYNTQTVLNSLLRLSLEEISFDEFLKKTLELVLSIPWLAFEKQGAIFLVEDESEVLVLKVQSGLAEIQKSCSRIPFGKCLCGRAALTKEIEFADYIDERHEISYEGMAPHGHYCVPILYTDKVIGVINIYLKQGHRRNKKEEDFLVAITNALAGTIEHKKAEEERKNLLEQLVRSEKLAAVGELISGVAHEINNPLTGIIGLSELLLMENKESLDEDTKKDLKSIYESSERIKKIVANLLRFARREAPVRKDASINELLDTVLTIRSYEMKVRNVEVIRHYQIDLPLIMADPSQLEQVFLNLITNAEYAIHETGKAGTLTVTTALQEKQLEDKKVIIEISDTGAGIPENVLAKIFNPFFTTKPVGKGTGLGLSVSYGIIKEHNGEIFARNQAEGGAVFTIELPVSGGNK